MNFSDNRMYLCYNLILTSFFILLADATPMNQGSPNSPRHNIPPIKNTIWDELQPLDDVPPYYLRTPSPPEWENSLHRESEIATIIHTTQSELPRKDIRSVSNQLSDSSSKPNSKDQEVLLSSLTKVRF